MKKHLFIYVAIILMAIANNASGQKRMVRKFRKYRTFITEVTKFVEDSNDKKVQDAFDKFLFIWNGPYFSDDHKEKIFASSNLILKKRTRINPDFINYFTTLTNFAQASHDINSYNEWEKGFLYCLKNYPIRQINEYMTYTIDKLHTNVLHKSRSTAWTTDNNNFSFLFDETEEATKLYFSEDAILTCKALGSEFKISGTTGVFDLFSKKWDGKNGRITWEKAGFSADSVYADVGNYSIDMKSYKYVADSVSFTHLEYFSAPLKGRLEERILPKNIKLKNVSFPRFTSYDKDLKIEIVDNISFVGGFTLYGNRIIGSSDVNMKATLNISRDNKLFMKAQAKDFSFKFGDKIVGVNTGVTIYIGQDSIYHPGLLFQFLQEQNEIVLIRTGKNMSARLYSNSYHNMNMDFQLLSWKMDSAFMRFSMLPGMPTNKAYFESADYYSTTKDNLLYNSEEINPLIAIKRFLKSFRLNKESFDELQNIIPHDCYEKLLKIGSKIFYKKKIFETELRKTIGQQYTEEYKDVIFEKAIMLKTGYLATDEEVNKVVMDKEVFQDKLLAMFMKKSTPSVQTLLSRLSAKGFLDYEEETGMAKINARFDDWLLARAGKDDYDLIDIKSTTSGINPNATLNLTNLDLKIYGIDSIHMSTEQNVDVRPDDGAIKLKKDRSFEFDGEITAGLVYFKGSEFLFNYEKFMFELQKVDTIRLWVRDTVENAKKEKVVEVKSLIERFESPFRGKLFIDSPENKSGVKKKNYPDFPIFDCVDTAYVYYDVSVVDSLKGVYSKDDFYFQIDPFVLNQLDSLDNSLLLAGMFYSGDIMPPFKDSLTIQEDKSLGFRRETPGSGVPIYGGKGTLFNLVSLDNNGLRAGGVVEYLNSKTHAGDLLFTPDSMDTDAERFFVEKLTGAVESPYVECDTLIKVHWEPKNDKLTATKIDAPLKMYKNNTLMSGSVTVKPTGLSGEGVMEFKRAKLASNLFEFKSTTFSSDSSFLSIKSDKSLSIDPYFIENSENTDSIAFRTAYRTYKPIEPYIPPEPKEPEVIDIAASGSTDAIDLATINMTLQQDSTLSESVTVDSLANDSTDKKVKKKKKKKKKKNKQQLDKQDLSDASGDKPKKSKKKKKRDDEETDDDALLENVDKNNKKREKSVNDSIIAMSNDSILLDVNDSTQIKKKRKLFGKNKNQIVDDSIPEKIVEKAKWDQVSAYIDFNSNTAQFKANTDSTILEFPLNYYIAYIEEFTWFMNDNNIRSKSYLSELPGIDGDTIYFDNYKYKPNGVRLISVHPKQDSINFVSKATTFSMLNGVIKAERVDPIPLADAIVFPDKSQPIIIDQLAKMKKIESAKILTNNRERYHQLYNAEITVEGRNNFTANADYDYVDVSKNSQKIHFSELNIDSDSIYDFKTVAKGKITDSIFTLSSNFECKGDFYLDSNKPFLNFDGAFKIAHPYKQYQREWVHFVSDINPDSITIPIDIRDKQNRLKRLSADYYLTNDSAHTYSTFLNKSKNATDNKISSVFDDEIIPYIYFDKNTDEYKISSEEKLRNPLLKGNLIRLARDTSRLCHEGDINFGTKFDMFKLTNVGTIEHDLDSNIITMDILMGIDFVFADKAIDNMVRNIAYYADSAIDVTRHSYYKNLVHLIDSGNTENTDKLMEDFMLKGEFKKIPDPLKHTITLTDLKLRWNTIDQSYRSVGKIGIGSINNEQINTFVNGTIDIVHKKKGDVFDMFFELNSATWYYFNYQAGVLTGFSSDADFNESIEKIKEKDRQVAGEDKKQGYVYVQGDVKSKNMFLSRLKNKEDD